MQEILFVFDTRDNPNWGGRATSLALGRQLERFGNVTSISNRWVTRPVPTGPLAARVRQNPFGDRALVHVLGRTGFKEIFGAIGLERDFVVVDPSTAVERFLKACRHDEGLRWLKHQVQRTDKVILNGEGALIFRNPPRRDVNFMMFMIELAHRLGKPTYFVNALVSDCPFSGTNPEVEDVVHRTLTKATGVQVRDPVSLERIHRLGVTEASMVPDALFLWAEDYPDLLTGDLRLDRPEIFDVWPESQASFRGARLPEEYVAVLGASSHPSESMAHWPEFFDHVATEVTARLGLPLVFVDSWRDDFLEDIATRMDATFLRPQLNVLLGGHVLANATGVIGGRYHPGILASLGGAPCTFLSCASHKTLSVQRLLEFPEEQVFPIDPAPQNVDAVIRHLTKHIEMGSSLRDKIADRSLQLARDVRAGLETILPKHPADPLGNHEAVSATTATRHDRESSQPPPGS
jgi:polysaccharide pyruvyl transferase WcaK-like protein